MGDFFVIYTEIKIVVSTLLFFLQTLTNSKKLDREEEKLNVGIEENEDEEQKFQ